MIEKTSTLQAGVNKNLSYIRPVFLLASILLSSCESKKEIVVNRQQVIRKEMRQVNAFYFEKLDSLENVRLADTSFATSHEIVKKISSTDGSRSGTLLKLQNEYDSLELALKKY